MSLVGLTALITGAGGGIGKVVATALAKEGANVILFGGNNLEKLKKVENDIKELGAKCAVFGGDLTDDIFVKEAFNKAVSVFDGIDILINNAGIAQNSLFENTEVEFFDKLMKINVRVPYILTQLALPILRKSKRASIINIASVVAHAGYAWQSSYSASKHALLGLTKAIATETYKDGIRVHAISPGGVMTDMVKLSRPDLKEDEMILPSDVAETVLFLLKNRTGAVIDEIIIRREGKPPFLV